MCPVPREIGGILLLGFVLFIFLWEGGQVKVVVLPLQRKNILTNTCDTSTQVRGNPKMFLRLKKKKKTALDFFLDLLLFQT